MRTLLLSSIVLVAIAGQSFGQVTLLPGTSAVPGSTPVTFDVTAVPGVITGFEGYLSVGGVCSAFIVNNPGLNVAGGDVLSLNAVGNALCSVNNELAIVAPSGAMDNHQAGAGIGFTANTVYTQFVCSMVDQVNHSVTVETYLGGVLQNTGTFTIGSTFVGPSVLLVFEDLGGMDEIRITAGGTGITGGFGFDDISFSNPLAAGLPCPPPPPPGFQVTSPEFDLNVDGAQGNAIRPVNRVYTAGQTATLNASSSLGFPAYDIALSTLPIASAIGGNGLAVAPGALINIDFSAGFPSFLNGGSTLVASPWPGGTIPGSVNSNWNVGFQLAPSTLITFQGIVIDPASMNGFVLSQASQVEFN